MSREIKRVCLDFDWPSNKIWYGYINPYNSCECPYCEGSGYSPSARNLQNQWYDQSHFNPTMTRSSWLTAECERLDIALSCDHCNGEGSLWQSKQLKTLYENWVEIEPPAGEGWQVWEIVSEGSPISPVFNSAESLVSWLESEGYSRLAAENFVKSGWVPSGIFVNSESSSHFYLDIESAVLQEA